MSIKITTNLARIGKGQALLVFSALALCVGKNQMCLTERWLFTLVHNGLNMVRAVLLVLFFLIYTIFKFTIICLNTN